MQESSVATFHLFRSNPIYLSFRNVAQRSRKRKPYRSLNSCQFRNRILMYFLFRYHRRTTAWILFSSGLYYNFIIVIHSNSPSSSLYPEGKQSFTIILLKGISLVSLCYSQWKTEKKCLNDDSLTIKCKK